jgi:DNA (cytosine-5)-methyltransferase 1
MWKHMARIIGEVRPKYAFVENSPMLTLRGLGVVLGDLSEMGYDSKWGIISAASVGAPHKRERIWIVANAKHSRYSDTVCGVDEKEVGLQSKDRTGRGGSWMPVRTGGVVEERTTDRLCDEKYMANTNSTYGERNKCAQRSEQERAYIDKPSWWEVESPVGRVAHGVAARVDRLKAIGNGQVPIVAATAFRILSGAAVK